MKIILFSGTHPRHLFVHEALLSLGHDCAAVIMEREELRPTPAPDIRIEDKINFERHFSERYEIENSVFGKLHHEDVFKDIPKIYCVPGDINSKRIENFTREFNPDLAFIFGTDLIKDPVLSALPEMKVNLHLGLSPWYRGSATLFWPFYFLQPQFAGATFHQILPEADAGAILHQSVPSLQYGDGIHDVGAKTVLAAKEDLISLFKNDRISKWSFKEQQSPGKLFLTRDFHPAHLRVIYNDFRNNIVDHYLDGALGNRQPNLVLN